MNQFEEQVPKMKSLTLISEITSVQNSMIANNQKKELFIQVFLKIARKMKKGS